MYINVGVRRYHEEGYVYFYFYFSLLQVYSLTFYSARKIFLGIAFPIAVLIFQLLVPEIFSQNYLEKTTAVNSETRIINDNLFRSH